MKEGHEWHSTDRFTGGGLDVRYWKCLRCGAQADTPNQKLSRDLKVRVKKGDDNGSPSLVMKPTKRGMEKYDYYSCEEWEAVQIVVIVHGL